MKGAPPIISLTNQLSLFEAAVPEAAVPEAAVPEVSLNYGKPLSPQQAKVRDHGAGNQVVVAGAGTGKTEALTQRILKLLVEGDGNGPVELENVLALTFTDKGAAEMRGRVYARLVEILRGLPRGAVRSRLENLRADFAENNRILTFDSFSFRLLSQFPQHSTLSGEVSVLDDAARQQLRRDVSRQFWNRVESTFSNAQKQELWEWLAVFSSRRAALETIYQLAEAETAADLQSLSTLPDQKAWRAEFDALVFHQREALWRAVEREIALAEHNGALAPDLKRELLDQEPILMGGRACPIIKDDWSAAFKKRWSPELLPGLERVGKRLRDWRDEAKTERDPELDWRSRRAVAQTCAHASWWRQAHLEWCQSRGVAAFSDIAAASLELLQRPEVAAQLRTSFSHVLIDEFQDTNWRQWSLIEALRDARRGNVLIVGDEKQAIFRFRGGDITVFDEVRKILLGAQNRADELTISRRSSRQLVEWTNRVFRDVLPSVERRQSYEAPFQALQSEVENAGNGLWKLAPARWHLAEENALADFKMPAELRRQRAGRALARFLRALQDDAARWNASQSPHLQFPDLSHISQRMARGQNAVGIVFTSHAVKSIFEAQLRAFDVPFVAVKGTGFWSSEPVIWTLHWLRLLLDASDQTAFVGLARCAVGGLSDVALLEWNLALRECEERDANAPCFEVEGFSPSRDDDARAWQQFTTRLTQWRDSARVEAASEVLEQLLESSELAFYEAGLPDCAQREENWRKVLDILREREAEGEGGLRALIDHLSGFARDAQSGDKEADAPLPAHGSIQLMTVWAAKGLGFPMTILAQLDDAPQSRGANLLRGNLDGARQMAFGLSDDEDDERAPKPWLWERLKAREAAEEEAQWRRLFYVACTRAETQLVLLEPESEAKSGAAWSNLCGAGWNDLTAIEPVEALAREKSGHSTENVPIPDAVVSSLPTFQPQELHLRDLAGDKAEKFESQARTWLENELEKRGAGEKIIREDVPFSAPASALEIQGASWVVGAWEWLAVLPSGERMLAATGQDGEIASNRVKLMALAARDAGFEVSSAWALWPRGEVVAALHVGTWPAMSLERGTENNSAS